MSNRESCQTEFIVEELNFCVVTDDDLESMVINGSSTTHRSAAPTPCPGC